MVKRPKREDAAENPDAVFGRIVSILEQARGNVVHAVNTNMVLAYWLIGREIVQQVQGGEERAAYGEKVVEYLSARLTERYGKGFSKENLQLFRRFYRVYSERLTIAYPMGTEFSTARIAYPAGTELGEIGTHIAGPMEADSSAASTPTPTGRNLALPEKSHPADTMPQSFSPQLSWSHYRALMRVDNVEARDFYEREAMAGAWDKRTLERQIQTFYYERILKSRQPEKMLGQATRDVKQRVTPKP